MSKIDPDRLVLWVEPCEKPFLITFKIACDAAGLDKDPEVREREIEGLWNEIFETFGGSMGSYNLPENAILLDPLDLGLEVSQKLFELNVIQAQKDETEHLAGGPA